MESHGNSQCLLRSKPDVWAVDSNSSILQREWFQRPYCHLAELCAFPALYCEDVVGARKRGKTGFEEFARVGAALGVSHGLHRERLNRGQRVLDPMVEFVDEQDTLLVGLEPLRDVCVGAEPADDPAVDAADRKRARQEPTVISILAADRKSVFPRLSIDEAQLDLGEDLIRLLRMDRCPPPPARH